MKTSTWSRFLMGASVMLLASLPANRVEAGSLEQQEDLLNERFAGKTATAKIDIPVVRSLYVNPDGSFDEQRYYERIKKFPTGLAAGESTELQRIRVEKDRIALCLHRQCGLPKFSVGRGTIGVSRRKTGRIEIEFGRPVEAADAQPDVVLRAIARVLQIEGEEPPSDFTPDALLGSSNAAPSSSFTTPPASDTAGRLSLLSAEADPTVAAPGQVVALVAHFEVSGRGLPVTEERQILFEGEPLLSAPRTTTADWAPGRHSTRLELTLPAASTPGVYTLRVTLRGGGEELTKEALFQVR